MLLMSSLLNRLGRSRGEASTSNSSPSQLACYSACLQLLATLSQLAAFRPHLPETIKVISLTYLIIRVPKFLFLFIPPIV
jgi:hypothetical protein